MFTQRLNRLSQARRRDCNPVIGLDRFRTKPHIDKPKQTKQINRLSILMPTLKFITALFHISKYTAFYFYPPTFLFHKEFSHFYQRGHSPRGNYSFIFHRCILSIKQAYQTTYISVLIREVMTDPVFKLYAALQSYYPAVA